MLPRAMRADIRRVLWRFMKPRRAPVFVELECKRVRLRAGHKSVKHLDRQARDLKTAMLKRELGIS